MGNYIDARYYHNRDKRTGGSISHFTVIRRLEKHKEAAANCQKYYELYLKAVQDETGAKAGENSLNIFSTLYISFQKLITEMAEEIAPTNPHLILYIKTSLSNYVTILKHGKLSGVLFSKLRNSIIEILKQYNMSLKDQENYDEDNEPDIDEHSSDIFSRAGMGEFKEILLQGENKYSTSLFEKYTNYVQSSSGTEGGFFSDGIDVLTAPHLEKIKNKILCYRVVFLASHNSTMKFSLVQIFNYELHRVAVFLVLMQELYPQFTHIFTYMGMYQAIRFIGIYGDDKNFPMFDTFISFLIGIKDIKFTMHEFDFLGDKFVNSKKFKKQTRTLDISRSGQIDNYADIIFQSFEVQKDYYKDIVGRISRDIDVLDVNSTNDISKLNNILKIFNPSTADIGNIINYITKNV